MSLTFIYEFIKYKVFSRHKKGHGIHSPFVFDFINDILIDDVPYYCFSKIEAIRKNNLNNQNEIEVNDMGAGSKRMKGSVRKITDIASSSAVQEKYGTVLFKTANYFQPKTILELGTSLGIGSLYLSSYSQNSTLYTIEGCENVASSARKNFIASGSTNIKQITGNFDRELPKLFETIDKLDMVYFDGNHKKEPTLNYFEQCLKKSNENSIFIFDDIYWSSGMRSAWRSIKKHSEVTVSIDLFQMGIVFFRKELQKQNFRIRY